MGNPGSRSFPAVVIYNLDCEDIGGDDAGQTVIFEREETPTDDESITEWNTPKPNGKTSTNGTRPA